MIETLAIRKKITIIRKKLLEMLNLPEKWESVYLYASVIVHPNKLETGEMFFYYFPKGIVKKNPVNVYEIPDRFDIDEDSYYKLAEELYDSIKDLRKEIILNGDKPWTNITLSIVKGILKIEFNYDELLNSEFSSYDRHMIWRYKYLDMPLNSYSRKNRKKILKYMKLNNNQLVNKSNDVYQENIYDIKKVKLNENYEKVKELTEKEKLRKVSKDKNIKNKENVEEKNKVLNDYLSVREKEINKNRIKEEKQLKNLKKSKDVIEQAYLKSQGLKINILNEEIKEKNLNKKIDNKKRINNNFNENKKDNIIKKRIKKDNDNLDKVHIIFNNDDEEKIKNKGHNQILNFDD